MPSLVPLPGSERAQLPEARPAGELDQSARIEVTLVLRRRAPLPAELVEGPEVISNSSLAERYGADPADVMLVSEVLQREGLTVTATHAASRRVKVAGSVADVAAAFGTTLRQVESPHPDGSGMTTYRYREGQLFVPAELGGVVEAVLGLDNRPQARAQFRAAAASAAATSFTAPQVAALYQFPAGTDGTGQVIAILELGGGYTTSDLTTYFSGLGMAVPSVTAVSVDGAGNSPGDPADVEVLLDIEVAGSAAPGASQLVYFAPNTDQGFIDAVSDAAHASPAPTVISVSWGQSEDVWTAQGRAAMDSALADAAALGVTVCAAAGDSGSSDGVSDGSVHVDFPASSPNALACGGTRLEGDPSTGVISAETVWNESAAGHGATGGGVSDQFPLPAWQQTAGVPARAVSGGGSGRGVPDVAGNADPLTGYQVVVNGQSQVFGGTSAVAPLWAALTARLAQATGKRFGLLQPLLYAGVTPGTDVAGFQDITSGNNGAYQAGPGWDACTGLGSPNGTALLSRLSA
ncbi:MAG: S8/S53 family peptidase [Streptosporangiaceae bacterium]|nr:S8/S53 family peptidase [Streptosporangiaceae bacterium]MBV9853494.1 S8/S53 family peptidase [Streptosporangiaceae bacterium]